MPKAWECLGEGEGGGGRGWGGGRLWSGSRKTMDCGASPSLAWMEAHVFYVVWPSQRLKRCFVVWLAVVLRAAKGAGLN